MTECKRCERAAAETGIKSYVVVQLTTGGPLHRWHRSDFASRFMQQFRTLCGARVTPQ